MSNVRPRVEASGLQLAVPITLVVLAVLGVGVVTAASPLGTAVLLGLSVFVVAASLPLQVLPSVSLWLFALVPVGYLDGVPVWTGRFWTPAVLVFAIWVFRMCFRRGRREFLRALRWMVPIAVVLLALGFVGLSSTRSVNWVALLFVTVAIPAAVVVRSDERTGSTLLRSWFVLGIGLSLLAVLESLLERNPLAPYYSFDQHWAVYRVSTTLGHPLVNGTFFSVTACLAAYSVVRADGARFSGLLCFLLSSLAAGLTGSRSGVYALVCGLGVGLLVVLVSGRTSVANKLLGIVFGTLALIVLPALPTIAGRASSAEGIASSLYRDQVVKLAGRLFLGQPWLGYGPGTSAIATARAGATLPLENAVLGTVISMGVVGLACLLVMVIVVLLTVARGRRADGFAAIAAFVVAGSAFPLWESNPATLLLVGLIVVATRGPDGATPEGTVVGRARPGVDLAPPGPVPVVSGRPSARP